MAMAATVITEDGEGECDNAVEVTTATMMPRKTAMMAKVVLFLSKAKQDVSHQSRVWCDSYQDYKDYEDDLHKITIQILARLPLSALGLSPASRHTKCIPSLCICLSARRQGFLVSQASCQGLLPCLFGSI